MESSERKETIIEEQEVTLDDAADKLISRRQVLEGSGKKALGLALMIGLGTTVAWPKTAKAEFCCWWFQCWTCGGTCTSACAQASTCSTACAEAANCTSACADGPACKTYCAEGGGCGNVCLHDANDKLPGKSADEIALMP